MKKDVWLDVAYKQILKTYGDRVRLIGDTVLESGQNDDVDTIAEELVWPQGGTETLIATAAIDSISSSSAADAQNIVVIGLDANYNRVVQTATLNGQNKVTLATPIMRCNTAYNDSATTLAGDVYIYESDTLTGGVPNTASKIHNKIAIGFNRSAKAAYTMPANQYGIITEFYFGVNKKNSANVDFKFVVKMIDKAPQTTFIGSASNSSGIVVTRLQPFVIIPPKTDFYIIAVTGSDNASVTAGGNMAIAQIL